MALGEGSDKTQSFQNEACTLDLISESSTQTQEIGRRLGKLVSAGDLLLLDGQLGTGKTTFTQGLASGMNIAEVVNSPTFTLLKEYQGKESVVSHSSQEKKSPGLALYHFDLYRLDEPEEIFDLGFEDYFYGSGVSVVEWSGKAEMLWPTERLYIRLRSMDETKRRLTFIATGARYCQLLQQFQKNKYATTRS
ncbi:MAG: tRNA (adenosine(37)-N6)-threonylcarbamoyltransferase complex ATPase subunit type 1 TsaE [Ktedonobacteraceae bacterium]|nr:tRNA (adenosine(37)-N6)-threonylcarbamoyltransferase complex ATPase subunit type 1 TsaE [Ktedonobacteraceae bacterium]